MPEVLHWVGTCLRVVLAVVILFTPGMAFWLVVVGLAVLGRWFGRSSQPKPDGMEEVPGGFQPVA
jgi:hypothetical protein